MAWSIRSSSCRPSTGRPSPTPALRPAGGARPGDRHGGGAFVRAGAQPALLGPHGFAAGRLRAAAVLWLGVHHDDHTGYPDCRPEFVEAADQAVRLGTQYGLRVQAPFVHWSKAEIVRWGIEHGVPYELTHSCYQGRAAGLRSVRHLPGAAGGLRRRRRRGPHRLCHGPRCRAPRGRRPGSPAVRPAAPGAHGREDHHHHLHHLRRGPSPARPRGQVPAACTGTPTGWK